MIAARVLAELEAVLETARGWGFLGPGPISAQIAHARGFLSLLPDTGCGLDLGSGGGIPGLVLAVQTPGLSWTLVEANRRRCAFLADAATALGLEERVVVLGARAEDAGRQVAHRAQHDVVVARSFGRPSVTAECAAPLLQKGGTLVVSEPPEGTQETEHRWPPEGLARLGLVISTRGGMAPSFASFRQDELCPPAYPRRSGLPSKSPLW